MSAVYDNWERLIRATLRREELKLIAQMSPSDISSSSSSSSTPSPPQVSPSTSYGLNARRGSEAIKNIETHLPNGNMYLGTLSREVPEGSGKYLSQDGSMYKRDFERGKAWEKEKKSPMVEMEEAANQFKEMFNKFNASGDGQFSSSELGNILNMLEMPLDKVQWIMEDIDTDGDDFIDINDLEVNSTGLSQTANKKELRDAFDFFDKDRNGKISANELHSVMKSLGKKYSLNDCCRMIRPFDVNGDGCVDFDEFKKMMGEST